MWRINYINDKDFFDLITIASRSRPLDPVCQMPNKIEKEVRLRDRNDFICNLDKQAEPLCRPERQPLCDICTKFFGSCRRVHLKSLVHIVWEVDLHNERFQICKGIRNMLNLKVKWHYRYANLVENLGRLVLDCLHLDLMRWILALPHLQRFL